MAGIDYCNCEICGERLFYDGDWNGRDYMENSESVKYIVCSKCYEKLLKRIEKLKKSLKRGK